MKTLLKISVLAVVLLIGVTSAFADIQITVYGKGGVVYDPPTGTTKICPEISKDKCTDILIPDSGLDGGVSGLYGTLVYKGQSYQVEIIEMPNLHKTPEGYVCQGIVVKGGNFKNELP
ncbi:MAG: hypothetical protein KKA81_02810 [Bacteroidetes bacterium]|nr:hypothetical protein [Bacteroidota bacterium]